MRIVGFRMTLYPRQSSPVPLKNRLSSGFSPIRSFYGSFAEKQNTAKRRKKIKFQIYLQSEAENIQPFFIIFIALFIIFWYNIGQVIVMNLLDVSFFQLTNKKHTLFLTLFFILCVISAAGYGFSFLSGNVYISLACGIAAVTICILFYYLTVFEKQKLLKLYKNIHRGITQEDTYIFDSTDGETEHDGVRLQRLRVSFKDDGQFFDRTLYFIEALPHPKLTPGQQIHVKTYQNIILDIMVKD